MKGMDDFDFYGKRVLIRVDLNSPVENGKVIFNERFVEHGRTIEELVEKNAKIIVLSHQGRRGRDDFISLRQHGEILSKMIGRNVKFVDDVYGRKALREIGKLGKGEILLLENVRFLKEETMNLSAEEHAKGDFVRILSENADIFINDAFSVCHRSHASVVGFPVVMDSCIGRVLEKELNALKRIEMRRNALFVTGGNKVIDVVRVLENMFEMEELDKVLTGGLVANFFLHLEGFDLGKVNIESLKEFEGIFDVGRRILREHGNKIHLPKDLALDCGFRKEIKIEDLPVEEKILDVGRESANKYADIIENSELVIFKGPLGLYEKKGFEIATKIVLGAMKRCGGFTIIGGGNSTDALKKLGFRKEEFSHVSLGGGALITYLSGKRLPGLEVLKIY